MFSWLWRKVPHDADVEAANRAVAQSERDKAFVKSRWPLIRSLTSELAALREQNNFAARIRASYSEGR